MGRVQDIRDAIVACFEGNVEPLKMAQAVAWINTAYPNNDFNSNTLHQQIYRSCPQNLSPTTAPKILWFEKSTKTYRLRHPEDVFTNQVSISTDTEIDQDEDVQGGSEFALEAHLRDYLVRNLSTVEKGLTLWSTSPASVEYSIANRFIDILAKDKDSLPVILELKLSKTYDRVIGQALLYRGLVSKHLKSERVRIMLVAGVISDELKIACSGLSDVSLFEYAISFQIKQVSSVVEEGS